MQHLTDSESSQVQTRGLVARAAMQSLWPAFIGAILCVGIVFSLFDPYHADGVPGFFPQSAEGIYTVTFLLLWLANAIACITTWLLAASKEKKRR